VGVGLRAGREFSAEGTRVRGLRLVFSRLDEDELGAAVEALARVVPRDA
jgi:DNA-binding transcriptional MocR family regulator